MKGAVLREFVLFCEQHDDRDRIARALAALDRAYPHTFDPGRAGGGVLASKWYPAEMVHVLVDTVIDGRSHAELDALAQRAASVIMGRTLHGVYKFLFSTFGSPELFARHANKLWTLHYDNGHVDTELRERVGVTRLAHTRVTRWISHHRFICRLNAAAAVPIYEALGCHAIHCQRLACISDGAPQCEWIVRFAEPAS